MFGCFLLEMLSLFVVFQVEIGQQQQNTNQALLHLLLAMQCNDWSFTAFSFFVSSDRSSCTDDGLLYIQRSHFFRFGAIMPFYTVRSVTLIRLGKTSAEKSRILSGIAQISEPPRPPIRAAWSSFFRTSKRCFTHMTGKKDQ